MVQSIASYQTRGGMVEGVYDSKFQFVCDAFVENFESRDELGASVAIYLEGKLVLDLWGGRKTPDGEAWSKDTLSMVYSNTKGATALCAHVAADRGLLDLDAPVRKYWPEFACNGKENTTVSMMLDHSAGVPHVRAQIKDGGYCDHAYMADLVAREVPFWVPGTRHGYQGYTFAWTVGELVRRAAGRSLGAYFRDEVAGPLGADFWIGFPENEEGRVAPMVLPGEGVFGAKSRYTRAVAEDPSSPAHLMMTNGGNFDPNMRVYRAAEIGSVNGMTNGRGLAAMYAPLASGGFLSPETIARMGKVSTAGHEDATLLMPTRFALGFMKSMDNRNVPNVVDGSVILSDAAFGHVGFGGSIGFADPVEKLSLGYSMNRMGLGILMNDRGQSLVDATYSVLGYGSNHSGVWAR